MHFLGSLVGATGLSPSLSCLFCCLLVLCDQGHPWAERRERRERETRLPVHIHIHFLGQRFLFPDSSGQKYRMSLRTLWVPLWSSATESPWGRAWSARGRTFPVMRIASHTLWHVGGHSLATGTGHLWGLCLCGSAARATFEPALGEKRGEISKPNKVGNPPLYRLLLQVLAPFPSLPAVYFSVVSGFLYLSCVFRCNQWET